MKYSQLTYQDIFDSIEKFADEYGDFLDQHCADEIAENFYEDYPNVNFIGMNKDEAYMFNSMLESMIKNYINKFIVKSVDNEEVFWGLQ
jgi:hypothetical protein